MSENNLSNLLARWDKQERANTKIRKNATDLLYRMVFLGIDRADGIDTALALVDLLEELEEIARQDDKD